MCEILPAESLIGILLRRKSFVSFRELNTVRSMVDKNIPEVLFDVSDLSVSSALHYNSNVFKREGSNIKRADNSEDLYNSNYIENQFISQVPEDTYKKIESLLDTSSVIFR